MAYCRLTRVWEDEVLFGRLAGGYGTSTSQSVSAICLSANPLRWSVCSKLKGIWGEAYFLLVAWLLLLLVIHLDYLQRSLFFFFFVLLRSASGVLQMDYNVVLCFFFSPNRSETGSNNMSHAETSPHRRAARDVQLRGDALYGFWIVSILHVILDVGGKGYHLFAIVEKLLCIITDWKRLYFIPVLVLDAFVMGIFFTSLSKE